eukprot:TRINITY_DN15478_c0_g1_i1.p1 TRINITY_DN15478_c0_g1~~TRINITY_DN15478_c0_g1_i1.p1  ORF type:complete len:429 (-),score=70.28 TRINITY_DN15478_c0_g1_i1:432-1718(-)
MTAIKLQVSTLAGNVSEFVLPEVERVHTLKKLIQNEFKIPLQNQRLLFGDSFLQAGATLKKSGLQDTSSVQVVNVPRHLAGLRVLARLRPLSAAKIARGVNRIIQPDVDGMTLMLARSKDEQQIGNGYKFDAVLDESSSQHDVFEEVAVELVQKAVAGCKCCVFAYGGAATGKSHTISGGIGKASVSGALPRSVSYMFELLQEKAGNAKVRLAYLAVWNEKVLDALSDDVGRPRRVRVRPTDGEPYVEDLRTHPVSCAEDVNRLVSKGRQRFAEWHQKQIDNSEPVPPSYHHLISLTVEAVEAEEEASTSQGQLHFVDLAAVQRGNDQSSDEANNLTRSLAVLGDVLHSVVSEKKFVNFQASKLTHILQSSLQGISDGTGYSAIVAHVSHSYFDLAWSTLEWAGRLMTACENSRLAHPETSSTEASPR